MSDSVPSGPEGLTAVWLEAALGRPVGPIAWERIGAGFGLDATLARVTWDGGRVVAKWSSPVDGRREEAFYRDLGPCIDVPLLTFFAATHGEERSVLLLEDRCDAEPGDVIAGTTRTRILALAGQAARWHARFWNAAEDLPPWRPEPEEWARGALPSVAPFLARDLPIPPRVRALLAGLAAADLVAHLRRLAEPPRTLIHGDVHLDNVLFDGDTPIVIDWPGHRRGSPAIDLARLLVEGLTVQQRPALQPEVLDAWAAALEAQGVTAPASVIQEALPSAVLWMVVATARWYTRDPHPAHPREEPLRAAVITRAMALLEELLQPM